jgi:hypothetical protein
LRSLLLDSLQRVKADGISRDKLIEFHDGIGGFRARRKKLGNLRLTQMSRQMHHDTSVFAPQLYSAPHSVRLRTAIAQPRRSPPIRDER